MGILKHLIFYSTRVNYIEVKHLNFILNIYNINNFYIRKLINT